VANIIARHGEHLLVVVPGLGHDLGQLAGQGGLVGLEDAARILVPEGGVAVRGRPAEVARVHLGRVFVKGGLRLGVFVEHGVEVLEVVEEVGVGQVAAAEVAEEGRETRHGGGGDQTASVGGEEVVERGEQEAAGFLFGGNSEELGAQRHYFVFAMME
jgi:hypothetical protein